MLSSSTDGMCMMVPCVLLSCDGPITCWICLIRQLLTHAGGIDHATAGVFVCRLGLGAKYLSHKVCPEFAVVVWGYG
jgi:hypothetical protein